MENYLSSQIRTLTYIENEDHPVFGTLVQQILHLLNSKLIFSDILIHQNSPLLLRQPKGLVAVTDSPITREELQEFFEVVEPNWAERIQDRAFDRAVDLHTARIRANCFSFQGKKRLGCVIRRFPKEPLALGQLGLRQDEQNFAQLTSGLVLIIGDTCQGKSTTIASMLDERAEDRVVFVFDVSQGANLRRLVIFHLYSDLRGVGLTPRTIIREKLQNRNFFSCVPSGI